MQPITKEDIRCVGKKEVAEILGVSVYTVDRYTGTKDFPKPFKVGKSWKWRLASINQWIKDREKK